LNRFGKQIPPEIEMTQLKLEQKCRDTYGTFFLQYTTIEQAKHSTGTNTSLIHIYI
jgi:hypothetical protein